LVDDFSIAPAPAENPAWSDEEWYDDETSGVDPQYHYTHAYSFGAAAGTVINGIPFEGVGGGTPSVPGKFTVTGSGAVLDPDQNFITASGGGAAVLAASFIYIGNPGVLTLQGLEPNKEYVLTLYSAGWDPPGERPVTFSNG